MTAKTLKTMSGEELKAHMAYISSPEFEEQLMAQFEREEQVRKSVTEEEAAKRHMPPIVLDECGTPRFRENLLVTGMMMDRGGPKRGDPKNPYLVRELRRLLNKEKGNAIVKWLARGENLGKMDMNEIAVQDFSQKDREEFAMLIGYSVGGAGDLSYFSDAMWERANGEAQDLLELERKLSR